MTTIFNLDTDSAESTDFVPFMAQDGTVAEKASIETYRDIIKEPNMFDVQIVTVSTTGEYPGDYDSIEVVCENNQKDLLVRFDDGTFSYANSFNVDVTLPLVPINGQRVTFNVYSPSGNIESITLEGEFLDVYGVTGNDTLYNFMLFTDYCGSIIYSTDMSAWVIDYGFDD